jgi:hypothetical protein
LEPIEYWKLCARITLFQAIVLIAGSDPCSHTSGDIENKSWDDLRTFPEPPGYGAIKTALLVATRDGELDAVINERRDYDQNGNDVGEIPGTIDLDTSYVTTASIRKFLKERNFQSDFFTPHEDPALPGYLDPSNPCYAAKLAAAVDAWTQVTTEGTYETESTPKQLMEKWLRINAVRYGLNKPDGKLNEDGISQITKIANWKPEGGAARTPGSKNPTTPRKTPKTH